MKKPLLDLSAEMAAAAAESVVRRGNIPWYSKLPADARAEVEQIKTRFRAGEYGDLPKRHAAKVIQRWAAARRLPIAGEWAIVRWMMD